MEYNVEIQSIELRIVSLMQVRALGVCGIIMWKYRDRTPYCLPDAGQGLCVLWDNESGL